MIGTRVTSGVIFSILLCLPVSGAVAHADSGEVLGRIVRLDVYSDPPDLLNPWETSGVTHITGSGVVIGRRTVLTAAHAVADAVSIEVRRAGTAERYEADVLYIGHDCDLALLQVQADDAFANVTPLPLGDGPRVGDHVDVYGFPVGGETVAFSSGVVSRVQVGPYAHSAENLLLAQIDAAVNEGASGGPAIVEGRLAGIVMQALEDAENVGYVVPATVIRHFLADIEDGTYDGFPRLGARFQSLQSPALRASLGLADRPGGALVIRVDHGGPADSVLDPGDVLLSIDGLPVADDLTVPDEQLGRVELTAAVRAHQIGETISLEWIRDGRVRRGRITLEPHRPLIPGRRSADPPRFFVFGGLVFQPLSVDYILNYFEEPLETLVSLMLEQNVVTTERREVLIIQKVLPDPVNRGYQDWQDVVVEKVDGAVPRDLEDLIARVDSAPGPWLTVEIRDGRRLVLDVDAAREAKERILRDFGLASDRAVAP